MVHALDISATEPGDTPRHVAITDIDTPDCADPGSPCRTVQHAVDVAVEGDVIKVADGIQVRRDLDDEPRLGTPDLGADEYWAPGALKTAHLPLVLRNGP